MTVGLANIILNINIVLGCISLALNLFVLTVLIFREKRFSKSAMGKTGGHVKREKE